MEPKPYDMNNPEDRARWYREMKGYLSLAGEDNFLIQGTDRKGRQYAWGAFLSIEGEFTHAPALEEIYEKYKHLDLLLGDPEMCGGTAIYTIAGELLRAIKKARGEK